MKNLSLHTLGSVVLLTIVSTIVVTLYARNPVPGKSTHLSRRAVARAEQSRRDSLNRLEALAALDENRWAFVSEELSGRKGPPPPVDGLDPCRGVAGFDGTCLYALGQKSPGRLISRKTNRKGETVFKFECGPPLGAECKLILSKNSGNACFSIGGSCNSGKVMRLEESRLFMRCEGDGHDPSGKNS